MKKTHFLKLGILMCGIYFANFLGTAQAVDRYDCSRFNDKPGQCKLSNKCKWSNNKCELDFDTESSGAFAIQKCTGLTGSAQTQCNRHNKAIEQYAESSCSTFQLPQNPVPKGSELDTSYNTEREEYNRNLQIYRNCQSLKAQIESQVDEVEDIQNCETNFPGNLNAQKQCRQAQYNCNQVGDSSIQALCESGSLVATDCKNLEKTKREICETAASKIAKATNLEIQAQSDKNAGDDFFRAYEGPVFSGHGLRSGANLAKQKLDPSISKENDIKKLAIAWTNFGLSATATIAVIAIIWAGILYITDFGDGERQGQAKKIIMYVVIGILITFSAYAIVNTVMRARFGGTVGPVKEIHQSLALSNTSIVPLISNSSLLS